MQEAQTLKIFVLSDDSMYSIDATYASEKDEKTIYMDIVYPIGKLAYGEVSLKKAYGSVIRLTVNTTRLPDLKVDKTVLVQYHRREPMEYRLFDSDEYVFLEWLKINQIIIRDDVKHVLQFFMMKHEYNKFSKRFDNENLAFDGARRSLMLRKFMVSLRKNGSVRSPVCYFDYVTDFFNLLMQMHHDNKIKNRVFLEELICVVLEHLRCDGLWGPHALISYFAHAYLKMAVRPLPYDLPIHPQAEVSFTDLNCAFVENATAVFGPLVLLWGYQSSCDARLRRLATAVCKGNDLAPVYDIILRKVKETSAASKETQRHFINFAKVFICKNNSQTEWISYITKMPLPLNVIVELIGDKFKAQKVSGVEKDHHGVFPLPDICTHNMNLSDLEVVGKLGNAPITLDFTRIKVKDTLVKLNEKIADLLKTRKKGLTSLKCEESEPTSQEKNYGIKEIQESLAEVQEPCDNDEATTTDKPVTLTVEMPGREEMRKLKVASHVIEIGKDLFRNCTALSRVTFLGKSNLEKIGASAFLGTGIMRIHIPASVRILDQSCFRGCISLIQVTFEKGSNLKEIGFNAFSRTGLIEIEIPASVEVIKGACFHLSRDLKSIKFEEGSHLKIIGWAAFTRLNIKTIDIPASVEEIGRSSFAECRCLETVNFSCDSQLKTIEEKAFALTAVKNLKVPAETKVDHCNEGIVIDRFPACASSMMYVS